MTRQEFLKYNNNKQGFEKDLDSLIEFEIKEFVSMIIDECFPKPCNSGREIFINKEKLKRLSEEFIPK